jgi:iron complex transport system substrate-binding protein
VRNDELHEVKSSEILQPGPAALTDGVRRIHAILAKGRRSPAIRSPAIPSRT